MIEEEETHKHKNFITDMRRVDDDEKGELI